MPDRSYTLSKTTNTPPRRYPAHRLFGPSDAASCTRSEAVGAAIHRGILYLGRLQARGSAHLSLAAHIARARGFAVRVRLANCIPQLRRCALRARSAGGMAVSLPSSGCDGALTRPGNKGMQSLVHAAFAIPRAAGVGRRSHIAAARRRKTRKKQNPTWTPCFDHSGGKNGNTVPHK